MAALELRRVVFDEPGPLGLQLGCSPAGRVVVRAAPAPGSLAAARGILYGDVLCAVDGEELPERVASVAPVLADLQRRQQQQRRRRRRRPEGAAAETAAAAAPRWAALVLSVATPQGAAQRQAVYGDAAELPPPPPQEQEQEQEQEQRSSGGSSSSSGSRATSWFPWWLPALLVACAAAVAATVSASGGGGGGWVKQARQLLAGTAGGAARVPVGRNGGGAARWRDCRTMRDGGPVPRLGTSAATSNPSMDAVMAAAVARQLAAQLRARRRPAVLGAYGRAHAPAALRLWGNASAVGGALGAMRLDPIYTRPKAPSSSSSSSSSATATATAAAATFSWWSDRRALARELGITLPAAQKHDFAPPMTGSALLARLRRARGAAVAEEHLYLNAPLPLVGAAAEQHDGGVGGGAGAVADNASPAAEAAAAAAAAVAATADVERLLRGLAQGDDAGGSDGGGGGGAAKLNLWLGGRTTFATHYDTSDNFLLQLAGVKTVRLWPPRAWRALRPFPFLHPAFGAAQRSGLGGAGGGGEGEGEGEGGGGGGDGGDGAIVAVLHPGDVLYVPPFWWHSVSCTAPAAYAAASGSGTGGGGSTGGGGGGGGGGGEESHCASVNAWSARPEGKLLDSVRALVPRALLRRRPRLVRLFVRRLLELLLPARVSAGGFVARALLRGGRYGSSADLARRAGCGSGSGKAGKGKEEGKEEEEEVVADCGGDAPAHTSFTLVEAEEKVEVAARSVAISGFRRELSPWRGCGGGGGGGDGGSSCCDVDVGVSELVLADLLEDVVADALGVRQLCAFLTQCCQSAK